MIGWSLLAISGGLFTAHAWVTSGLEAALLMAAIVFFVGGLWKKMEEAHERDLLRRKRIFYED